jgi:hypothetical protein
MLNKTKENFLTRLLQKCSGWWGGSILLKPSQKREWHYESTWTSQQQAKFSKWLTKLIRRKLKYGASKADMEAGWFILNFGWNVVPETDKSTVPYFARREPSSEFLKLDKSGKTGRGTNATRSISSDREDRRESFN